MSETRFLIYLTPDDRIRHYHFSVKNKIANFTLQYEALINNLWRPIVRYDTAHGFAHIDRLHPDGSVEKEPLFHWNYNEALTFSHNDIRSNWEWYRERFEREMRK